MPEAAGVVDEAHDPIDLTVVAACGRQLISRFSAHTKLLHYSIYGHCARPAGLRRIAQTVTHAGVTVSCAPAPACTDRVVMLESARAARLLFLYPAFGCKTYRDGL
jgi:hypothetical protein